MGQLSQFSVTQRSNYNDEGEQKSCSLSVASQIKETRAAIRFFIFYFWPAGVITLCAQHPTVKPFVYQTQPGQRKLWESLYTGMYQVCNWYDVEKIKKERQQGEGGQRECVQELSPNLEPAVQRAGSCNLLALQRLDLGLSSETVWFDWAEMCC